MRTIWLTAATLLLAGQLAKQSDVAAKQRMFPVLDRFKRIRNRLEKRQLPNEDRAYVLKMFAGSYGYERYSAFLCLEMEVDHGFLYTGKLMSHVEGQLKIVPGWEGAATFMHTADKFCGLKAPWDEAFHREFHQGEAYERDEKSAAPAEREMISSLEASKSERNRLLAGSFLVAKRHLPPEARTWVLAQVRRQVEKAVGEEKVAWEVVQRTVSARNPH